jgi:pyruvate ferredoxin oxidoreductase delta subunit
MEKKNLMGHINENSSWQELTDGGFVLGSGNSAWFNTGDWRVRTPIWSPGKCKQCLLCYPVCPDSSIPVQGGKRQDFDFMHCKGCAICARVCPFGAIAVVNAGEEGTAEAASIGHERASAPSDASVQEAVPSGINAAEALPSDASAAAGAPYGSNEEKGGAK